MANDANSISLVSIDSTKQHGVHVFDVSCHICTGSHESTHLSGLTKAPTSCQSAPLTEDSDLLSDNVTKSDQTPRKKICLAQRLKMYSAEIEKNSISSAIKQVGSKYANEMVSDADEIVAKEVALDGVKQNSGVHEMHSSHESTLDKPKLTTDAMEWQTQTVWKLQNESLVEQRNSDKQKVEVCSAEVLENSQKDNVTNSLNGTAEQEVNHSSVEFDALQGALFKQSHVTAGYVPV